MSKIKVACLLLAAGKSSRMSPDHKLLLKIDDSSVLQKTAKEITGAKFFEVIAVTGYQSELVEKELRQLPVKVVHNPDFEKGLHSSIRAGVLQLHSDADFFAVCLADQPALMAQDYNKLIETIEMYPDKKLFHPSFNGQKGNPAVISKTMIPEILKHTDDDRGCFYLFDRFSQDVCAVEMTDNSALMDIDTPELFLDMKFHLEKRGKSE